MTTINLYQNKEDKQEHSLVSSKNNGFIFSLLIVVFTLLSLWGLKFYITSLEKKNEGLDATIVAQSGSITGLESLEQVVDTQNRLSEIKNNLKLKDGNVGRKEMVNVLDLISGELDRRIAIEKFNYSNEGVSLILNAGNFNDVANQISNFKKSKYFSEVAILSMERGDEKISCTVSMQIKK